MNEAMLYKAPKQPSTFITTINKFVCDYYNIPIEMIEVKTRKREIVQTRQVAMSLSKQYTTASLEVIGKKVGKKDHSTVLHACKIVNDLIDTDKSFRYQYNSLSMKVSNYIMNHIDMVLVCSNCGSSDLETKRWVNLITGQPVEDVELSDRYNNWCNGCKSHPEIILKSEYEQRNNPEGLSD